MFAVRCGTSRTPWTRTHFHRKHSRRFARIATAVYRCYGDRGTVGTLRLRWLPPEPRGDSETQACKRPLPERASHKSQKLMQRWRPASISPRQFRAAARAAMSGRPEEVHSATVHPQHLPGDPAGFRCR